MREATEEEKQSIKDYIDKIKIDPLENIKKENENIKKENEELKKKMREILLKIFKRVRNFRKSWLCWLWSRIYYKKYIVRNTLMFLEEDLKNVE